MVEIDIKKLVEAGVHFGHRVSRWHPRMRPYIYGKHNQIHIIDLRQTVRGLLRASNFLSRVTEAGHQVIFVGTKPQAREVVRSQCARCGMHYVVNRWLGGTLTNFNTIRSRLQRLEQLEGMEADNSILDRSKKEISRLRRERRKIHRNLEGIRRMSKLPAAMVVSDVRRDHIAVAEAKLQKIPVIAICDTDTDPQDIDLVVPGNDDAYRSLELIVTILADAVVAGRDKLVERQAAEEKKRQDEEAAARAKAEQKQAAAAAPPAPAGPQSAPASPSPSSPSSTGGTAAPAAAARAAESTPAAPTAPTAPAGEA